MGGQAFSQSNISKGNWLVGGSASFSSTSISDGGDESSTSISIQPGGGYFIANKFAVGLALGINKGSSTSPLGGEYSETQILISPFVRAYFLPESDKVNIFAQAQYGIGSLSQDAGFGSQSVTINAYGISAGPAIFLNPSVALEIAVNYVSLGGEGSSTRINTIGGSVGFQIHLGGSK